MKTILPSAQKTFSCPPVLWKVINKKYEPFFSAHNIYSLSCFSLECKAKPSVQHIFSTLSENIDFNLFPLRIDEEQALCYYNASERNKAKIQKIDAEILEDAPMK